MAKLAGAEGGDSQVPGSQVSGKTSELPPLSSKRGLSESNANMRAHKKLQYKHLKGKMADNIAVT